jgi:hypothetical protein
MKGMPRKQIDWESIQPSVRKLRKDELLGLLHDAFHALPAARRVKVFREHGESNTGKLSPKRVLNEVKKFHADSLARHYYEYFNVNSQNFMEKSEGTDLWITECNQLFDKCMALADKGHHPEARQAMDLLFELLEQIDRDPDSIIFFADEAGSWQVGVDYGRVLPAYFTSLAALAEPDEYAERVTALIKEHASYKRDKLLKAARKVGDTARRSALKNRGGKKITQR